MYAGCRLKKCCPHKYRHRSIQTYRGEYDGRVGRAPAVMKVHTIHTRLDHRQRIIDVEECGGHCITGSSQALMGGGGI